MNFDQAVSLNGNIYNTFAVSTNGRRLQNSGTSGYQIVVINSQTVQFIFPPGSSQNNYNIQITNPQNVVGPNGELPNSLSSSVSVDSSNVYSTTNDNAPSSIPNYFIFLSVICVFSFIFDL